ncbi:hypothetical protein HDU96_010525 [Phlyctochytrium bullatum]|nr:hypothetical protein HDU96_010525 [Phlyctochytrium bullatum]
MATPTLNLHDLPPEIAQQIALLSHPDDLATLRWTSRGVRSLFLSNGDHLFAKQHLRLRCRPFDVKTLMRSKIRSLDRTYALAVVDLFGLTPSVLSLLHPDVVVVPISSFEEDAELVRPTRDLMPFARFLCTAVKLGLVDPIANVYFPFAVACFLDSPELTEALLRVLMERGAQNLRRRSAENPGDHVEKAMEVLLSEACSHGSARMLSFVLQHRPHYCDRIFPSGEQSLFGETPLHRTARHGYLDCVALLLRHGVSLRLPINARGISALHLAATGNHLLTMTLLLAHNHAVDAHPPTDRWTTPLHLAVQSGHIEAADVLLDHGANLEQRNELALTPLLIAVQSNNVDMVGLLLDRGADLAVKDAFGDGVLHAALSPSGRVEREPMIRLLVSRGAAVNARGSKGYTPLHRAVTNRNLPALPVLLDAGADLDVRNAAGKTPLDMAREGFADAVDLLEWFGIDRAGSQTKHAPGVPAGDMMLFEAMLSSV